VRFVIRGRPFDLTPEAVVAAIAGVPPDPLVRYAVRIGDHWYPPKQVLARATGLPPAAFTTQDAYRIVSRLGFEVVSADTVRPDGIVSDSPESGRD